MAILRHGVRPTGYAFAVVLGVSVGIAGLGKLNIAAVSLAMVAITLLGAGRGGVRSLAASGAAAGVAFLALWLITGQRIADVTAYVRAGAEVTFGYAQSMGLMDPRSEWVSAVGPLTTLILAGMVWQRTRGMPRRDGIALAFLFAIALLASYKGTFVRDRFDAYVATLLTMWPIAIVATRSWVVAGTPIAGMLAVFLALGTTPVSTLVRPVDSVAAFARQTATVMFGRAEAAASTASIFRSAYSLPPDALAALAGHTVHIEPWDAAVAYAYPEVTWRPQPVFQAYTAYTRFLDAMDGSYLAGPDAPERILWLTPPGEPLSIDGRNFWYDSPAAKVEMICRYVSIADGSGWQVLGRVEDRCDPPIEVVTVQAAAGSPVSIPSGLPSGILTVRVDGVGEDPVTRLVTLAYRAPAWTLAHGPYPFRLVLGTAAQPMVLSADEDIGYSDPLQLGEPLGTVTVGPEPGQPGFGSPLVFTFEVTPLTGSTASAAR
jgi:hypothetical protein